MCVHIKPCPHRESCCSVVCRFSKSLHERAMHIRSMQTNVCVMYVGERGDRYIYIVPP